MGLWAPNKYLKSGQTNCRTNNTSVPQNPSRIRQSSQRVKAGPNKVKKSGINLCYQVFLLQRTSVLYRIKTLNLEGKKKVPLYSVAVLRWLSYANAGTQSCMFMAKRWISPWPSELTSVWLMVSEGNQSRQIKHISISMIPWMQQFLHRS